MQGSMYDEKNRKIPRPMNAFMIFAAENRSHFKAEFPEENNKDISIRLGESWRKLPKGQRELFYEKARQEERKHKKKYPNYVYCPGVARQKKRERLAEKARLDAILKAEIDSVLKQARSGQYAMTDPVEVTSPVVNTVTEVLIPQPYTAGLHPQTTPPHAAAGIRPHPYQPRLMPMPPQAGRFFPPHFYPGPGAVFPRPPTLAYGPYPPMLRHGRPPFLGPIRPFYDPNTGQMYRPWHPGFIQYDVKREPVYEVSLLSESDHTADSISQTDTDDSRQSLCTTPSDTSQDANPLAFRVVDINTGESLDAVPSQAQIRITQPQPSGSLHQTQSMETIDGTTTLCSNPDAALLSCSSPPYNLVVTTHPQNHFGTPVRASETYPTTFSSDTQLYMKCTLNKLPPGQLNTPPIMPMKQDQQPVYASLNANEIVQIPNEFIEQIAKHYFLLQGGEKLLSPTVIGKPVTPKLGRQEESVVRQDPDTTGEEEETPTPQGLHKTQEADTTESVDMIPGQDKMADEDSHNMTDGKDQMETNSVNPEPPTPNPEDPTPEDPTPEDPTPEDTTPKDTTPEDPTPEDPTPEDPTPDDLAAGSALIELSEDSPIAVAVKVLVGELAANKQPDESGDGLVDES